MNKVKQQARRGFVGAKADEKKGRRKVPGNAIVRGYAKMRKAMIDRDREGRQDYGKTTDA